jgi:mono/diheme cytochrome c family protein
MKKLLVIFLASGAGALGASAVQAQGTPESSRGELLYSAHCNECHRNEIHWRSKSLVKDWASLYREVRRWQTSAGPNWDPGDTEAIASYLNETFYHFSPGTDVRRGE